MAGPRPGGGTGVAGRSAAVGGAVRRVGLAWAGLEREQRTAAVAAIALFVAMFLPWYSRSAVGVVKGRPVKVDDTLTAFGSFSFVEAAVLLVAIGVLWMLFARGEGKAFHLPFGDGNVIFAAGLWVCALVFYRQFDKPSAGTAQGLATSIGVSWGIFVTFMVGLFLAFSGQRLRLAHLVEPPLPGDVAPSDRRERRRAAPAAAAPDRADPPTDVTRVAPGPADLRKRPDASSSPTVVDRTPRLDGPEAKTLLADEVPEFPSPRRPAPPPAEPTRADEPPTDADGQLRFDG